MQEKNGNNEKVRIMGTSDYCQYCKNYSFRGWVPIPKTIPFNEELLEAMLKEQEEFSRKHSPLI